MRVWSGEGNWQRKGIRPSTGNRDGKEGVGVQALGFPIFPRV